MIPVYVTVLKPLWLAVTVYSPGIRFGATYSPSWLVMGETEAPVLIFLTVMFAPGTTAPVASCTVPEIVPRSTCANKDVAKQNSALIQAIRIIVDINYPSVDRSK
jgi:hypothetical protein